jgi:hypothetical protein
MVKTLRQAINAAVMLATAMLAATAAWLLPRVAWAAPRKLAQPDLPKQPAYVLEYIWVCVLLALAMVVVCRRSSRIDESPPDDL